MNADPSIAKKCFQALDCVPVIELMGEISTKSYLRHDFEFVCAESSYMKTFLAPVLAGILFIVVGVPAMTLRILTQNKRFLHADPSFTHEEAQRHERVQRLYGSLYRLYESGAWYFEVCM